MEWIILGVIVLLTVINVPIGYALAIATILAILWTGAASLSVVPLNLFAGASSFPLLAIPLAFVNPRGGRSVSLILALLVYVVYSNCMSMVQAWVTQGRIGVGTGFVGVHLVMLLALAMLFYRRLAVYPFWRWLR